MMPLDFSGKNIGVGCSFFLQGIFPTQGSNSGLLYWQVDSSLLSHQGALVIQLSIHTFFFFQILSLYSYYKILSVVPCAIQWVFVGYLFYIWWWWCLVTKLSLTLRPHGLYPTRLLCPWDFLGKNTGVGCHLLVQGSSWSRIKSASPALAGGFFTAEPPKKSGFIYSRAYMVILSVSVPNGITRPRTSWGESRAGTTDFLGFLGFSTSCPGGPDFLAWNKQVRYLTIYSCSLKLSSSHNPLEFFPGSF